MGKGAGTNGDGRDTGKLRVDVGRDGELEELPLFLWEEALAFRRATGRISRRLNRSGGGKLRKTAETHHQVLRRDSLR